MLIGTALVAKDEVLVARGDIHVLVAKGKALVARMTVLVARGNRT